MVFECEIVMSEDVCRISEWPLQELPWHSITLRRRRSYGGLPHVSDLTSIAGSARIRREGADSAAKL